MQADLNASLPPIQCNSQVPEVKMALIVLKGKSFFNDNLQNFKNMHTVSLKYIV